MLLFIAACDPTTLAIAGTTIVGTELVCNQEGIGGSITDSALHTKICKLLLEKDSDIFDRVELSIKHGNIVVIGYMKNKAQCEKAMELIKGVNGYKKIFDETKVQEPPTARDLAIDSSITSRIKSSLAFDGNVQSRNYDVTTVKGVVYICGTAQSRYERDVVLNCARTTSGVEKVVAYISINKDKAE
jgi:osmotically-inducible protein OsmY